MIRIIVQIEEVPEEGGVALTKTFDAGPGTESTVDGKHIECTSNEAMVTAVLDQALSGGRETLERAYHEAMAKRN